MSLKIEGASALVVFLFAFVSLGIARLFFLANEGKAWADGGLLLTG